MPREFLVELPWHFSLDATICTQVFLLTLGGCRSQMTQSLRETINLFELMKSICP
jgi:hypothetical protein